MASILTQNGIPPQLVGAFNAAQQESMTDYARNRSEEYFNEASCPEAVIPFVQQTMAVVKRFQEWGAVGSKEFSHLSFRAGQMATGETTFADDFNLHADTSRARSDLIHHNWLYLRTLCVSRDPAGFIDLTDCDDMMNILDRYKSPENERVFKPDLLSKVEELGGHIFTPDCWETIVFDGATPHLPKGASMPNRRILMSGWFEMQLPDDWKTRVQNGDVPHWTP